MKITDIKVSKVDSIDDQRFSGAYLLTRMLDDGTEQECPFFFTGDMTPDYAARMFKLFADAIAKIGPMKEVKAA